MSLLSINCTPVIQRLFSKIVPGVDEDATWLEKAIKSLSKKLRKTRQLEEFETVLQTKDPLSKCITLWRSLDGRLQISHRKVLPHVVFCRLFRWPDLHSYHELKSLGNCQYSFHKKQQLLCINPYHFYRAELLSMLPILNVKFYMI
ncbi:Protein mothers against dpp [Thelohanellus kitauei]|uniref:Protein mothers against dpp n=1 Tax=Thelohanellus kitauei TaxID=669202 RepID=A0A0C2NA54_THEKT|nr:Protein mothers against dpp [Thelohanellus kitauei]